jgi:hypothetical protein
VLFIRIAKPGSLEQVAEAQLARSTNVHTQPSHDRSRASEPSHRWRRTQFFLVFLMNSAACLYACFASGLVAAL